MKKKKYLSKPSRIRKRRDWQKKIHKRGKRPMHSMFACAEEWWGVVPVKRLNLKEFFLSFGRMNLKELRGFFFFFGRMNLKELRL